MTIIDTISTKTTSCLSGLVKDISLEEVRLSVTKELEIIKRNHLGIKLIDSFESIDGGFYLYYIRGKFVILKVEDSESILVRNISDEELADIVALSYAVRFISWEKNSNIDKIISMTKTINSILSKVS